MFGEDIKKEMKWLQNRSLSKRSLYTVFNVNFRFSLSSKAQLLQVFLLKFHNKFCSEREWWNSEIHIKEYWYESKLRNVDLRKNLWSNECCLQFYLALLSGSISKAVHCISGRKKVFPQTFLSELSWVMSKSKDFSFCKYVKINFLELKTFIAGKRINLSVAGTENCPN